MVRPDQTKAQQFCDKLNSASPLVHWYVQSVDFPSPMYTGTMLLYYRIDIGRTEIQGIYPMDEMALREANVPEHDLIKMVLERVLYDALHKIIFYKV